jgi:hypothetical protein
MLLYVIHISTQIINIAFTPFSSTLPPFLVLLSANVLHLKFLVYTKFVIILRHITNCQKIITLYK